MLSSPSRLVVHVGFIEYDVQLTTKQELLDAVQLVKRTRAAQEEERKKRTCLWCCEQFKSRNELFRHLRKDHSHLMDGDIKMLEVGLEPTNPKDAPLGLTRLTSPQPQL